MSKFDWTWFDLPFIKLPLSNFENQVHFLGPMIIWKTGNGWRSAVSTRNFYFFAFFLMHAKIIDTIPGWLKVNYEGWKRKLIFYSYNRLWLKLIVYTSFPDQILFVTTKQKLYNYMVILMINEVMEAFWNDIIM